MKKNWHYISLLILLGYSSCKNSTNYTEFKPGEPWLDIEGKPINAHGGGILEDKGKYYWFGEIKHGETWKVESISYGESYRVKSGGISCYSSADLYNWKFEGIALKTDTSDSLSEIHTSKVMARPRVIYNETTRKYVMWVHIDSEDYSVARAGIATSDTPAGPYTYLGSIQPNEQMSRDQGLFKNTDGKAYQICSSENNATIYINELTNDYLKPTGKFTRIFIGLNRGAPAMVKHLNKFYVLTSAGTGLEPSAASYAVSDSVLGEYKIMGNPCTGKDAETTFNAQCTFILPVGGSYIAMFDRWNKTNLEDSRYVWLPLRFENGKMIIEWQQTWKLK